MAFSVLLYSELLGYLTDPSWYKVFQRGGGRCSAYSFSRRNRGSQRLIESPTPAQGRTGLLWERQGGGPVCMRDAGRSYSQPLRTQYPVVCGWGYPLCPGSGTSTTCLLPSFGDSPLSLQVVRRLPSTDHGLSCCRVSNLSKGNIRHIRSTLEEVNPGCLIGSGKKFECHSGPQDKFQSAK